VAQQLSEAYDESWGISRTWIEDWNASHFTGTDIGYRQVLWGGGGAKETLSLSLPARGGGFSSYWRLTDDIWTEENKNKPLPQAKGGGWNELELKLLRDAMPSKANHTFDVVFVNYNNWIPVDPSVGQKYWDAITLSKQVAGAKAVILVTYPSHCPRGD
jgi:hypothetical protein